MHLFRHLQREWKRLEQGSSPTNKTLYFSVFERLKLLLPPLEEQNTIAAVGDAFDSRIEHEHAYLQRLHELQRGLTKALLSGRVRLPPHLFPSNGGIHAR
jgi:type I restriction enzyme S subunit